MISMNEAVIGIAALGILPVGFLIWRRKRGANGFATAPLLQAEPNAIELAFGASEDLPALTISNLPRLDAGEMRMLDIHHSKIDLLSPAFQAAPSLLTGAQVNGGKYMKVVINGPLAKCKDGNGFRAFTRGEGGRIKEQARLFDAKNLKSVVNAAAVWQVASVIVAQKHMADIKESLDEIKRGVDEIKDFLESQRRSVLTGAMEYLDQARKAVAQGEFPDAIRHQLEAVERDLVNTQQHLLDDINKLVTATSTLEHKEWFGTEDFFNEINRHQRKLEEVRRQWLLCVQVRTANWLVLAAFPGDDALKSARLSSILASLDDVTSDGSIGAAATEQMRRKINELHSRLNSAETLKERREKLTTQFTKMQVAFDQAVRDAGQRLHDGGAKLLSYQKPMTLAVEMDGDQIVAAYELGRATEKVGALIQGAS